MKNLILKEENVIKDTKKYFGLKKEPNYTSIKRTRNLFRQRKKLKQLRTEYLEILTILLSMKKKKIIISQ